MNFRLNGQELRKKYSQNAGNHFVDVNKTIHMPKGLDKDIPDLILRDRNVTL